MRIIFHAGILLFWIEGAGHNSNTDSSGEVNAIIEEMASELDNTELYT